MWLVHENTILTKDNLLKRNWQGDKRCCFCNMDESVEHLFFDCSAARCAWNLIAILLALHLDQLLLHSFGNGLEDICHKITI